MTIKKHEFTKLTEYHEKHTQRAERLEQYQTAVTEAKANLNELQTQYEYTFTQAVQKGVDATADLQKIDEAISVQSEVILRRERDFSLAIQAIQGVELTMTPVEVVEEFCNEFKPMVEAEFTDITKPKLKLARDLIISAMIDHRDAKGHYDDIRIEIAELSRNNNWNGLTDGASVVPHPTDNAPLINRRLGVIKSVRSIIDDVYKQIEGMAILDFEYIDVAPKTKGKVGN